MTTTIPQNQLQDINVTNVAPTINDDITLRYTVGSKWFNTASQILYVCEDGTAGAAVWTTVAGSGGTSDAALKVGVGSTTDTTWFNIQYPFTTAPSDSPWDIAISNGGVISPSFVTLASGLGAGDSIQSNASDYSQFLPDMDNTAGGFGLRFDSGKQTIFQMIAYTHATIVNDSLGGMGFDAFGTSNEIYDSQGTNEVSVGFVRKNSDGTWYTRTGNGAAFTENLATISDGKHSFRVEYDPANTQARFYLDGSLIDTITTTLPTASAAVIGFSAGNGAGDNSRAFDALGCPSFAVEI